MPSACHTETYVQPRGGRWEARRGVRVLGALACVLSLLQGCRSTDAVAPGNATIPAASQGAAPRNLRLSADTVVAGASLTIAGELMPVAMGTVSATLNGVALSVRALSPSAAEFSVPTSFPCGGIVTAKLVATVGGVTLERDVLLQTATRVSLTAGASESLDELPGTRCVELVANGNAANARFVVAVVNTRPFDGGAPSWRMSGVGTGSAAGLESSEQAGSVARAVAASVIPSNLLAAADADTHVALLHPHSLASVPAARDLWRSAAPTLRRVTKTVTAGDTVRFTAMAGSCHRGQAVQARVVYAGANVVVYEDVGSPSAGRLDATYRALGQEYDAVMHPLLLDQVGNPLAMRSLMNGSDRVALLFTRFVNDSLPGTAAFVSACNFYPRGTFGASNEAALVYGRVAGASERPDEWRRAMRATVMHEAKHLASFAERMAAGRDFEEPWLEEATARVAEELYARTFTPGATWRGNVGFAESVQCEVMQCDDRPLVMWKHFTGLHAWLRSASTVRVGQLTGEAGTALNATAANAAYASGWALVRHVLDRHVSNERSALRALVAGETRVGMAALATLAGKTESNLLTEWATSLAVESAPRTAPLATAPNTWSSTAIIGGMASMFPGVFSAQPLPVARRTMGAFAIEPSTLSGSARYLEISGDFARGTQVVHLTASQARGVGVSFARVQ